MLFSQTLRNTVHNKFMESLPMGLLNREILMGLHGCSEDERIIMEFFYSTMPASDIGDYDFSLYKKFADFGLFLMENPQWDKQIPEEIFLDFVVYYRINNERIEDCRPSFYNALQKRISGKSMREAALEVNLWCAEHVSYKDTDARTASPLTVLKSSYGRCGEESTLVVSAMRSVGIPARQLYTPRWAHCDDNHAWVEVWCDGDWYYLGACEPEPVLNRGWFDSVSARAMLIDSKAFLNGAGEEVISQKGQVLITNQLSRYALSRSFTVIVKDTVPAAGVAVHFELLNSSEFFPISTIMTDKAGRASLTLGFGSIHIHAVKDSRFVEVIVDTGETDSITIDFSKAKYMEGEYEEALNFRAPKYSERNVIELTEEQKALHSRVIECINQKRREYEEGFYKKKVAEELAIQFSHPQTVLDILKASEGNFQEIYDFLSMDFGAYNKELQLLMLESLSKKDYRDVQCNTLEGHFKSALEYEKDYPPEIFLSYIMCPRVYYEELAPYRELISSIFDIETKEIFRKQPKRIWEYVLKFQMDTSRYHEKLIGTPAGIIRSGLSGSTGRKVLFTAICRTLGIPARINPIDLVVQYYGSGEFINVEEKYDEDNGNARLILMGGEEKWSYFHNWTISVLKEGNYLTLDIADCSWINGKLELLLKQGNYRVITSNRAPDGNQFARKYCFNLAVGEAKTLVISLRKIEL